MTKNKGLFNKKDVSFKRGGVFIMSTCRWSSRWRRSGKNFTGKNQALLIHGKMELKKNYHYILTKSNLWNCSEISLCFWHGYNKLSEL